MQYAVRSGKAVLLPLLAYYGTGRLWQEHRLTNSILGQTAPTLGYANCLDSGSDYKLFAKWFRYWSWNASLLKMNAFRADREHIPSEFDAYLESVTTAIDHCLHHTGWSRLEFDFALEEIVARHELHGVLPVAALSDGLRSMIGMVADLAFRATKLNHHLGAAASQLTPGVVLIDEVDMHLHPAWQQLVLGNLRRAFPLVQFIVTTHSPQVLTTVPKRNIRVITQNTTPEGNVAWEATEPEISPLAWESGDALAYIMGTNTKPDLQEILTQVHAYEQLISSGADPEGIQAGSLKKALDEAGFQIPAADAALWRFLGEQKRARDNGHG